MIESTNHILKTEFIYQYKFRSLEELRLLLFDFVHWYNHRRIHGAIGYMTPIDYRRQYERSEAIIYDRSDSLRE